MLMRTIAQLIAETICECDGKNWMEITPPDRDRYGRIASLAEHRIRINVFDENTEAELAQELKFNDESGIVEGALS